MAEDKEKEYTFTVNNASGEYMYTKKESELTKNERDLLAGELELAKSKDKKYNYGDRVIIKIGQQHWIFKEEWKKMFDAGFASAEKPRNIISEDEHVWWYDMRPDLVGKHAMIINVVDVQGITHYSLNVEDHGNISWFTNSQLIPVLNCPPDGK